jgi:hypothetical protein
MKRSPRPASQTFPSRIARNRKRSLGRTAPAATPVHVRTSGTDLDESTRRWIEDRATRRLAKYALHIERLSFRFEDVNGPRGGKDIVCRGKAVLSGLPSTIVQKRAHTPRQAFDLASRQLARGVDKAVRRVGRVEATQPSAAAVGVAVAPRRPSKNKAVTTQGSLIGRRVGRSWNNLLEAASRPEKRRGDAIVDTSLEGVSATDRKVGARATAKRNTLLNTRRATATLEDSATGAPSRKSTRRSANRTKSGSKLGRKTKRALHSPKARARRAIRKAKR